MYQQLDERVQKKFLISYCCVTIEIVVADWSTGERFIACSIIPKLLQHLYSDVNNINMNKLQFSLICLSSSKFLVYLIKILSHILVMSFSLHLQHLHLSFLMLQLYVWLCRVSFISLMSQHCAYAPLRFTNKTAWLGLEKYGLFKKIPQ